MIEKRNGNYVSPDDTEFLDIYAYDRAGEPAPTLEFSDANIEYLEYSLTVWKPDYTSFEAAVVMEPVKVYPDGDAGQEGILNGGKFEVPDFTEDGVYALEVTAVDTAGNRSELNVSTYARETEQMCSPLSWTAMWKESPGCIPSSMRTALPSACGRTA